MNQKVKFTFSFRLLLVLTLILNEKANAQAPNNGIFFQAVARDNFSNPAMDRKIYVQSSILQNTVSGTKVLIEEFQTRTDATGIFSISIGQGTRIGGTAISLTGIDWAQGPFFLNLKIAITPIAPTTSWNYRNEWIDLGTTSFGVVPYALYAGSAAGLNDKLNINDTASMLAIYAKAQSIITLETKLGTKIASSDTTAMLAPYKKIINEIISSNITSLTADAINNSLNSKVNLIDSNKVYVTPSQLAAKTFNISPINDSIATKLNVADSIIKYITPTQLASIIFDPSEILNKIGSKSDTSEITKLINQKANKDEVEKNISLKVNIADSTIIYITPTQLAAKTFDITPINLSIASKVDKIIGKQLSSNDYTNIEKEKLATITGVNTGDQDLSSLATFNQVNLKLNISDTGIMLSERFKRDTASLSNRINLNATINDLNYGLSLKLNISDTANMLNNRINRDTSFLSNRINLKLNSMDTTTMLSNRFNRDTSFLSNRINLKANSSDIANDLSLKANTTDLNNGLNSKLNSTDTAAMLSTRFNRDTISLSDRINLKLNISDTANMLSNRFNRDTSFLSNRINLKANSTDVTNDLASKQTIISPGTTSQFYRGDKTWQTITYATIGAAPTVGSNSINSLGTITSGTWNGTTIAVANGGTGVTTLTSNGVLIGNGTSAITTVVPSTNGNVLTSNGTNWVSSTPSVTLIREVANEFIATNAQTIFTLTQTPSLNSKVKMFINGVRISNTAYSLSATTLTYNATNNGAYSLTAGDRIQFDYYY